MDAPKVVYLGLDAGNLAAVRRWMVAGDLPTLARLGTAGRMIRVAAPYGTFVGGTWPSFATGRTPDHHGHWCWNEVGLDLDDYYTSVRTREGLAFWRHLDAAGHVASVIDVPHTLKPVDFRGMFVSEWGAHDRIEGPSYLPSNLPDRVGVGSHPVGGLPAPSNSAAFAPCDQSHRRDGLRDAEETRAFVDDLLDGIDRKQRLIEHALADGPDALIGVFGESHCVGHQLFHLHDPRHERHDPAILASLGEDPLLTVFRRLDVAVGALLERTSDRTLVLVHLSHGMTAHHDGTHLLDPLLWRIEQVMDGLSPGRLSRLAGDRLTTGADERVLRAAYRFAGTKPVSTAPVGAAGRQGRRWFQAHNNTVVGGVRLNLVGREMNGIVSPDDRDAVLCHLEQQLLRPINLATGARAVRRTVRCDDVYDRRPDDRLPDLFVEWDRSAQIERVWCPELGVVHVPYEHWRTGDHHDGGLLFAHGPQVSDSGRAPTAALIDLPVTICAAFGVELPDADGTPIPGIRTTAGIDA